MHFESCRAALLAIDLQRAFCAEDGSMAAQGRDIAAMRTAAARSSELVVAARRANVAVIWTRMMFRPDYSDGGLLIRELRPNLARVGALRAGTSDVDLAAEPDIAAGDFVIDKPRFSAFLGTPLETILNSLNKDHLLVCGVTTSMCVETTVRDAGQRDLSTFVVADACGDFERGRHEASLAAMAFGFARVIGMAEALAALEAGHGDFPVQ